MDKNIHAPYLLMLKTSSKLHLYSAFLINWGYAVKDFPFSTCKYILEFQ